MRRDRRRLTRVRSGALAVGLLLALTACGPGRSPFPPHTGHPAEPPLVTSPLGPVTVPVTGDIADVHDPTIAKEGDTYYLFSTHGGIHVRASTDLVHWTTAADALPAVPAWVRASNPAVEDLWAPDVSWWNGRWHLYYSASVFATRNSAIGLATATTLDADAPGGGWTDHGPVLTTHGLFTDPDRSGSNAIDPNVVLDRFRRPWLLWGSFFDGLFVQPLLPDGHLDPGAAPVNVARRPFPGAVEGGWMTYRAGWWYLFGSYDRCCAGTQSTYNVRVGRSRSITGPFVDRDGVPLLQNGGTPVIAGYGDVYGPGHGAVYLDGQHWWLVHHVYDGSEGGRPELSVRPVDWSRDGWPVARGWDPSIPTPPPH